MSEAFEGYERRYCDLSADLSKKTFSVWRVGGEQKKSKSSEIKAGLAEAEHLIRKMEVEAHRLQPNLKSVLLSRLREYKADLNSLKNNVKQNLLTNMNAAAGNDLITAGKADTLTASTDHQRDRLLTSTEKLNNSGNRISESRKVMLETEGLGFSLLQDLHQQRESLLQADNTLQGMDHNISSGRRVINSMSRRMSQNKWIIWSVVTVLVLVVALILYLKLAK